MTSTLEPAKSPPPYRLFELPIGSLAGQSFECPHRYLSGLLSDVLVPVTYPVLMLPLLPERCSKNDSQSLR